MSNLDLIKMSLGNLWRRKLRTLLTVLGVVIGTASIITTLSLGFGMKEQNKKLLAQMGPVDVINVVQHRQIRGAGINIAGRIKQETAARRAGFPLRAEHIFPGSMLYHLH